MINKKLNDAQAEKVNGGEGKRLHPSTVGNYLNKIVVYEDTHDSCAEHRVYIREVNMDDDYVIVEPLTLDDIKWFSNNHKDAITKKYIQKLRVYVNEKGSKDITKIGDNLYKIDYDTWSTTYFYEV